MILLDTNVLSELMKAEPAVGVLDWLDRQPAEHIFVSAITRAEIELGIALLPDGRRRRDIAAAAKRMMAEFTGRCFAFDELAAVRYGQLVADRTRLGQPITVEEAQIAAIALAYRLRLATRNERDFEGIEGLQIINPWTMRST